MTALPDFTADQREHSRGRSVIDCGGAQLHIRARSLAAVLSVNGEIDASNADLVADAIRRFSRLDGPLILDLSHLDFLGLAGLRALLVLDHEHQQARRHFSVVSGAALRRLTRVFAEHNLPIVDSVPEALQLIEGFIRSRRLFLSGQAGRQGPQRKTARG
jgi:anti-anti-sigma factor